MDPHNRTLYSHEDSTEKVSHSESINSEDIIPLGLRDFYGFAVGAQVSANSKSITETLISAQIFAWISVSLWLLNLLLVTSRFVCHLDFPSYYFSFHDSAISGNIRLHDGDGKW
jgi:hypothetical protein